MVACYCGCELYDGPEADALVVISTSSIVTFLSVTLFTSGDLTCRVSGWGHVTFVGGGCSHVTIVGDEACDFCGGEVRLCDHCGSGEEM